MSELFAGINLPNKSKDFLELKNINLENNVRYLKNEIASIGGFDGFDFSSLEIIHKGQALKDDDTLSKVVLPGDVVHCFMKTSPKYEPYNPPANVTDPATIQRAQDLFNVIAHTQINVSSRISILQKIRLEYPEFRRNMGAQALIRDSVLFNTLHTPEVVLNVAKNYPLIIEAAPFIVDTVKKELTRTASLQRASTTEAANDSTNSSEDDSSTNERTPRSITGPENAAAAVAAARASQVEILATRSSITRQQLQSALASISYGAANSLSNTGSANPSAHMDSLNLIGDIMRRAANRSNNPSTSTSSASSTQTAPSGAQPQQDTDMDSADIPLSYRTHQYADQLRTMAQMGFTNWEENLQYLNLACGNIENAVNLIMGLMN